MDFSRRTFVKVSAAGAAILATGMGVYTPKVKAASAGIASLLSIDPATLEYKVFSTCCYWCTDEYIVSHYQPVAIIEVIKGGGDDAISGQETGSLFSTGVDNNDYSTFEARIWEIPEWAIAVAMAYQDCKLCGIDAARSGNTTLSSTTSACAQTDQLVSKAVSEFNEQMPDCMPKLLYSTEFDPSWRTGCRDWAHASLSNPVTCNDVTGNISFFGMEICIGAKWGPLYPRQMATPNDSAPIAAGIAAYRAIHISAFADDSFPFNGALSVGKLQQTSPAVTVGFTAGSMALDTAMRQGSVDTTHTYTFVWWVPVSCCKTYDEIMGLCSDTEGMSCD